MGLSSATLYPLITSNCFCRGGWVCFAGTPRSWGAPTVPESAKHSRSWATAELLLVVKGIRKEVSKLTKEWDPSGIATFSKRAFALSRDLAPAPLAGIHNAPF